MRNESDRRNPYTILQVAREAEPEVIEAAYKKLAFKYHPDRYHAPDATRRMQDINWAYTVLRDPVQRSEYDKRTSAGEATHSSQASVGTDNGNPAPSVNKSDIAEVVGGIAVIGLGVLMQRLAKKAKEKNS